MSIGMRRMIQVLAMLALIAAAGGARPAALTPPPAAAETECLDRPYAHLPADELVIADTGNDRIVRFLKHDDSFGPVIDDFATDGDDDSLSAPAGVATAPWETIYVADTGNDRVVRFSKSRRFIDAFGETGTDPGKFDRPTGIAVAPDMSLYVVDRGNHRVQRFDSRGNFVSQFGGLGTGPGQLSDPRGIAVSWTDGSVYVADTGNGRIQKFDAAGTLVSDRWGVSLGGAPLTFLGPEALSVHPLAGHTYVADTGGNRIVQLDTSGRFVRAFDGTRGGGEALSRPRGVAASARHGVFVMDSGSDRLRLFGYDGAPAGSWGESGSGDGRFTGATAVASTLRGVDLDRCFYHDFDLLGAGRRRVSVFFTTDNGLEGQRIPDVDNRDGDNLIAIGIAERTADVWRTFHAYGLGEPQLRREIDFGGGVTGLGVDVLGALSPGLDGWCCSGSFYSLGAAGRARAHLDFLPTAETIIHEMFHQVQPFPLEPEGQIWFQEGGAVNAQDKVDPIIDTVPTGRYLSRVGSYLATDFAGDGVVNLSEDYRTSGYQGGLFWTYVEEQLGNRTPGEPGYGMSAIARLHTILTDLGLRGFDALARLLEERDALARDFLAFWTDFTVANALKDLGGSPHTDAAHLYVDDDDPAYPAVARDRMVFTSLTHTRSFTRTLPAYSGQVVQVLPSGAACAYVSVTMTGDRRTALSGAHHRGNVLREDVAQSFGRRHAMAFRLDAGETYGPADGVTAVLTGLEQETVVDVTLRCEAPAIEILRPTLASKASVGPPGDPGTFVAFVRVATEGGAPIRGLGDRDFAVIVGARSASARAIPLDDVYALVVRAPTQGAAEDFDLHVRLGPGLADVEPDAVRYTDGIVEHVLVVDDSGSMASDGKLDAAKRAANLLVTEMDVAARGALVRFDTTAERKTALQDVTGEPARGLLRTAIRDLVADRATAIVAATGQALDELEENGLAAHRCTVTLLTDGLENQADAAARTALLGRLRSFGRPCPISAFALGPDADMTLLQTLADATGGEVLATSLAPPVPDVLTGEWAEWLGSGGARPGGGAPSGSAPRARLSGVTFGSRLASFYDLAAGRAAGRVRVFAEGGGSFVGAAEEHIPIDASVTEAMFAMHGDVGLGPTAALFDPAGNQVTDTYAGATTEIQGEHRVVRITGPDAGTWRALVTGQGGPEGYVVLASARSPIALDVVAHAPGQTHVNGSRVPIVAMLHDAGGPIGEATVTAEVLAADGQRAGLRLLDDGRHGDGGAGDGIYGGTFTRTNQAPCHADTEPEGSGEACDNAYLVTAVAVKGDVRREAQTGFVIGADTDADVDGLPDGWEADQGLDPNDGGDVQGDADADALNNFDEYWRGTEAQLADTDGGGETDGSEANRSADPLDASDDAMGPMRELDAQPADGRVVLRFGLPPDSETVRVFRRTLVAEPPGQGERAWSPWEPLGVSPAATGAYTPTALTNGTAYQFRVAPVNPNGVVGRPAESPRVIPGVDPDPPEGTVLIDDGAESTSSYTVTLKIGFSDDAVEMRVGNGPDLSQAPWRPLARQLEWRLDGSLQEGDLGWVYVAFRDGAGNVGGGHDPYDAILYKPSTAPSATPSPTARPATPSPTPTETPVPPSVTPTPSATPSPTLTDPPPTDTPAPTPVPSGTPSPTVVPEVPRPVYLPMLLRG